jgi:transcriptional regulator with XRE-family HTH domain
MNRLKELRNSKNLSLAALAEELSNDEEIKMNSMQLSRYERGENSPKAETWQHIADYFEVSVPYLMGYEENMTADGLDSWLDKSIEKMAEGLKDRLLLIYEQIDSDTEPEISYEKMLDLIEENSQRDLVKNQLQLLIERYKETGEFHVFEKWKELVVTSEHESSEFEALEVKSLVEAIQNYHGKISASNMKKLIEFHETMFEVRRDQFELDDLETESLVHHYASILRIKEQS